MSEEKENAPSREERGEGESQGGREPARTRLEARAEARMQAAQMKGDTAQGGDSLVDDLERWAREKLGAMDSKGLLDDGNEDVDHAVSAPSAERNEGHEESRGDEPSPPELVKGDAGAVLVAAHRTPAGFAVRPAHAVVLVVMILAAAVLGAWLLSARQMTAQRGSNAALREALGGIQERLTMMKTSGAGSGAETLARRPTAAELQHFVNLGHTRYREGRFNDARRMYQAAVDADTSEQFSDEARYGLGMCFLKAGQSEEALAQFNVVVSRFPGSKKYARASVELARLLMARQRYSRARRLLYRVIGCRDRFGSDGQECVEWAYYGIAKCYEGEGGTQLGMRVVDLPSLRRDGSQRSVE